MLMYLLSPVPLRPLHGGSIGPAADFHCNFLWHLKVIGQRSEAVTQPVDARLGQAALPIWQIGPVALRSLSKAASSWIMMGTFRVDVVFLFCSSRISALDTGIHSGFGGMSCLFSAAISDMRNEERANRAGIANESCFADRRHKHFNLFGIQEGLVWRGYGG